MPILYGFVLVLLVGGIPYLFYMLMQKGPMEFARMLLILWSMASGLMWLANRAMPQDSSVGIGLSSVDLSSLLSLPWGMIWVISTLVLVVFHAWFWFATRGQTAE